MESHAKRKIDDADVPDVNVDPTAERRAAFTQFFAENKRQKMERKEKIRINTEKNIRNRLLAETKSNTEEKEDNQDIGRKWTISIALPVSLLSNAISNEMRTYIAGQIARATAVFSVDEIVIYNDGEGGNVTCIKPFKNIDTSPKKSMLLMARILQYLECPQYLRKYFFPVHDDLKFVGLLNPLDTPHHLRKDEVSVYREGASLNKEGVASRKKSFVNVGLEHNSLVFAPLEPMQRVTVKFRCPKSQGMLTGDPVHHHTPRTEGGKYWGYDLRLAESFNAIFCQSPYETGYDLTIGVGKNGENVNGMSKLPSFQHAVVVFDGLKSIEEMLEKDEKLEVKDPHDLFDVYVNTCPSNSSSFLRTDESVLIGLSVLKPKLTSAASNK